MLAGAGGQHLMARPYSQDLRDRVIGSVASGRTCRATAALFGVSVASVVKWSQRWRASGSAAAKPMGGWKQLLLTSEREWLLARIAEKPDLTLRAVVGELAERGTPASYGAVWRFFKREGISLKKSLYASEQDRADIAGVDEVVGAFLGFEAVEECADAAPGGLGGARIGFAQQGLELGEDLLDRVEVGRVTRQEEQLGAHAADQLANRLALVAAEVVHDDNVAGAEGGDQELFDVSAEAGAVDRPVDDAGGGDPVAAQCRQKGQCPPAAVRQLGDQTDATRRAPVAAGHIGLSPGFVDEHQALGGSSRPWYCCHRTRRRAMSARSCSLAYRLFLN